MIRSLIATLLIILSLSLSACSAGISGLNSYISSNNGYQFLYPNGWVQVNVSQTSKDVDVVFRDLIERSENLSVIISDVPPEKHLEDIGTPSEVGYELLKKASASLPDRQVELMNAESRPSETQNYYILEYQVTLPNNQQRHNLASVAVDRGKLYTFNISTTQERWEQVKPLFEEVVNSFSVIY
ncbi:MAG: photosystem II reaction center PsbP [Chroococcales cyanobacterium]